MHPNPTFRKAEQAQNIALAQAVSFGTLAINAPDGPLLSHIPFQLSDDGAYLEAHLVRSNPIWAVLEQDQAAVVSVIGTDAYISPDWYGVADQVPTWNYTAVHLRGRLTRLPQDDLLGVLERLSAAMEARLLPKPIWTMDKMSEDALARMLRQIVPIALHIEQIDGTWKLGQNKPDEARLGAAEALGDAPLADLMRAPPC